MNDDNTLAAVDNDETDNVTEINVRITPKQKLIAKIAGAATAAAGLLALGYKLGQVDTDDELEDYDALDVDVELDDTIDD